MNPVNLVNVEHPVFGLRDPDARGYFGAYGGRFVPETLVAPIEELTRGYLAARADASFGDELSSLLRHYVGRPTPLYEARRLAAEPVAGQVRTRQVRPRGIRILLKREDLTHTGAHKINNALGQALLAKRMGKTRDRRRDRRRTARRGDGHGVRAARPRVPRLHGRRGHAAAGVERRAHATARRDGAVRSMPAARR